MSSVPQPHRAVDLIIGGAKGFGDSLGTSVANYQAEQTANAPIHPAMQAYIERLLKGEDPTKLGLEARNDPNMARMIDERLRGPQPAGIANNVPDVGVQGGQPSLGAPGQFSPAAGPGTQPGFGGPPAAPAQPQRSLSAQPNERQANLGTFDIPLGGQQVPAPGLVALPRMAQPTPGAPQVSPQEAGAKVLPTSQKPAAQAQPSSKGSAQPASPPITNRQFASMQNMLPAAIAASGRQDAARIQAETKMAVARLDAEKSTLLAIMRENGMDTRHFEQMLKATETLDVSQQQAVLKAVTDLMKAQISAGATLGAARTRADAPKGPNATLETLKKEIDEVKSLKSKTDWEKQPETVQRIQELEDNIKVYKEALGVPSPGKSKPSQPAQQPSAPAKSDGSERKRIKVRLPNGATGTIDEAYFDPKTMTKL